MKHEGSGIVNLINDVVVIKTVLMDVVHCSVLLKPLHFIKLGVFPSSGEQKPLCLGHRYSCKETIATSSQKQSHFAKCTGFRKLG
jgi:hypothetical protein